MSEHIDSQPLNMAVMKKNNKAFGSALRALRKQQHLSQESLALDANLDRTYISLLELGQRSPTLDTMMSLCGPLKVSLATLASKIEAELERCYD